MFTLVFRAHENGRLSEKLQIDSRQLQAEAYNMSYELLDIRLKFYPEASKSPLPLSVPEEPGETAFYLEQNVPNPWSNHTQIGFFIPAASPVSLRVRDVRGRVLQVIRRNLNAGYNRIELDEASLGSASGLLYYTLESGGYTQTKKMIWLGRE